MADSSTIKLEGMWPSIPQIKLDKLIAVKKDLFSDQDI